MARRDVDMKTHFKSKTMVFRMNLLLIPLFVGISLFHQPVTSSIVTSQDTSNLDFYDYFKNVPIVKFDPKQNSYDDGIIGEIAYYPMGGACKYCAIMKENDVYEPFSNDIFLEICTEATSGQILYQYFQADGALRLSGRVPIVSSIESGKDSLWACHETEYGAFISLPEQVSQYLGQHTVSIKTKNGEELFAPANWPNRGHSLGPEVSLSFTIDIPDAPRFYYREDQHKLYLVNFQRKEFINVYCFGKDIVSNTFRVESNGKLVVNNFTCGSQKKPDVIVIGSQTGKVFEQGIDVIVYRNIWEPFSNCPWSRLDEGDVTKVSDATPLCNRLRTHPNTTNGEIIDCLDPGTFLTVVDGPQCNNGMIWWQVRVNDTGMTGWTVEGDADEFWLLPGIISDPANYPFWPEHLNPNYWRP